MSDALKAGTAATDDRDGAAAQSGTSGAAGGNAEVDLAEVLAENERLKAQHAQALAEKTTLENLRRENEELRSRAATPPNAGGAGFPDPRVGLQQVMQQRIQQHAAAAMADPANAQDSALVVGLWQQNQMLAQQIAEVRAMQAVPIDEQAQVQKLQREYAQNGETISPATARRLLEADRLREGAKNGKQQAADRTAADEDSARNRVATRTVGVAASDLPQKTMTMGEYVRRTSSMTPREAREFDGKLADAGTQVLPED